MPGQAALQQANRRSEDLRAAAAGAEARERDSAAQVERANGIIERLTVGLTTSNPPTPASLHCLLIERIARSEADVGAHASYIAGNVSAGDPAYEQADQRIAKEKARRRAAIMTRLEEENAALQVGCCRIVKLGLAPALPLTCGMSSAETRVVLARSACF